MQICSLLAYKLSNDDYSNKWPSIISGDTTLYPNHAVRSLLLHNNNTCTIISCCQAFNYISIVMTTTTFENYFLNDRQPDCRGLFSLTTSILSIKPTQPEQTCDVSVTNSISSFSDSFKQNIYPPFGNIHLVTSSNTFRNNLIPDMMMIMYIFHLNLIMTHTMVLNTSYSLHLL